VVSIFTQKYLIAFFWSPQAKDAHKKESCYYHHLFVCTKKSTNIIIAKKINATERKREKKTWLY